MARVRTFDDWIDLFKEWQKDIALDPKIGGDYRFEDKFGDLRTNEIEFGDWKGSRKWETVLQIPDQRVRDALQHLIVYQGDTEFASVEQQRNLFENSPGEYDLYSLVRVMREEMRHGWQMSYLLVKYFGDDGKREALKLLERRAFEGDRLLGSFNQEVRNWLDFFTYTEFVDRDGKFQLQMLSSSAFAPLARSMGPMLKEESFHLGTGHSGLRRVVKQGVVPIGIMQKYFNKWIPTAYDLFGKDGSTSAHWAYVWGLKGRYDEATNPAEADRERLNEASRKLYQEEVAGLIDQLNKMIPEGQPKLYTPDLRFNRAIGDFAGQPYSVTGELLTPEAYRKHCEEFLPGPKDEAALADLVSNAVWIEPREMPKDLPA